LITDNTQCARKAECHSVVMKRRCLSYTQDINLHEWSATQRVLEALFYTRILKMSGRLEAWRTWK